jgi:hypothetical protein
MASLVLTGDTSGQVTIAAPAVAGTTTLTLPATTGTVLADTTVGVCRAWVNFNGTGTVAIRASFNVTSITDNAAGDYTVNFTTAMTDANYSFNVSTSAAFGVANCGAVQVNTNGGGTETAPTTSAFRFTCVNSAVTANIDPKYVQVVVLR